MDIGLLLLSALPAGILFGHATQNLFGWFSGPGPAEPTVILGAIGQRPYRPIRAPVCTGADAQEGPRTFAEKRPPRWERR